VISKVDYKKAKNRCTMRAFHPESVI